MEISVRQKLNEIGMPNICPIALILKAEKILMVNRSYSPDSSVWTLPGGKCEIGETIEAALRREVKEEVDIDDLEIRDFIANIPSYDKKSIVPIFLCFTDQAPKLMEPEKFSEMKWFTLEEYSAALAIAPNPESRQIVIDYLTNHGF